MENDQDTISQIFSKIFSDLDSLNTKDAKLVLDDTKSKFELMAKIKLSQLKRQEDQSKLSKQVATSENGGINDFVAQTQVPASDVGQPTPNLIDNSFQQ